MIVLIFKIDRDLDEILIDELQKPYLSNVNEEVKSRDTEVLITYLAYTLYIKKVSKIYKIY
jgi:hypothetical protein